MKATALKIKEFWQTNFKECCLKFCLKLLRTVAGYGGERCRETAQRGSCGRGEGEQDVDITVGTHLSSHCLQSINLTLKALGKPPMHCLEQEELSSSPPARQEKTTNNKPPQKRKRKQLSNENTSVKYSCASSPCQHQFHL